VHICKCEEMEKQRTLEDGSEEWICGKCGRHEMHHPTITATQAVAMWKVKDAEMVEKLEAFRVEQRNFVFAPVFDAVKFLVK
jgi:hypothetical protein